MKNGLPANAVEGTEPLDGSVVTGGDGREGITFPDCIVLRISIFRGISPILPRVRCLRGGTGTGGLCPGTRLGRNLFGGLPSPSPVPVQNQAVLRRRGNQSPVLGKIDPRSISEKEDPEIAGREQKRIYRSDKGTVEIIRVLNIDRDAGRHLSRSGDFRG